MQELGQALFDLLGFGLGSGEPEDMVVGLCRAPDYAALGQSALASGGSRASLRGIIREARGCSLPALVRSGRGWCATRIGLIIPQWTDITWTYLRPDGFDRL